MSAAISIAHEPNPSTIFTEQHGISSGTYCARFAEWADRHAIWLVAIWVTLFMAAVMPSALSPLWYDEILTYYGAKAPAFECFYTGITHFDFNPPLLYALVRLSLWVFGDSVLATRLPSILAFLGTACLLFWHVRRRSGGAYGLLAVGAVFSAGFLDYASEARPYALALTSFTLAFVCWSEAMNRMRWSLAHLGLAAGVAGMFLSHCFAAPFAFCILVGELVRSKSERGFHLDKKVWISLALPVPLLATYFPLIHGATKWLYPSEHVANSTTLFSFYARLTLDSSICFILGIVAALLIPRDRTSPKKTRLIAWERAFIATAMITPTLAIMYTIHGKIPFFYRYGLWVVLPITLLLVRTVEYLSKGSQAAALLAAFFALVNFSFNHLGAQGTSTATERGAMLRYAISAPPFLPIVAAGGSRFIELDRSEPSKFVSRLYYLTDRNAEIQYTRSNRFEDFGIITRIYPVRGHVEPYPVFVASHKHFLILLFPGDLAESWIVQKLKADGATVTPVSGVPYYLEAFWQ